MLAGLALFAAGCRRKPRAPVAVAPEGAPGAPVGGEIPPEQRAPAPRVTKYWSKEPSAHRRPLPKPVPAPQPAAAAPARETARLPEPLGNRPAAGQREPLYRVRARNF